MKFERVKGNVPVFSGEYDGRDRTIFGGTEQSNDINQQFTPEFKKGWGIVGKNEFPTLQDFNALGFTHSALIGYLYQSGVAQWVAGADYYTGSIAVQGVDLYVAVQDKPTSQPNSLQGWRLVSPALLNATGNSTAAPMTQKAVTDALAKKWDIQQTVGSGNVVRMSEVQKKWDIQQTVGSGKVIREGAYGVGLTTTHPENVKITDSTGFSYYTAGTQEQGSPIGVASPLIVHNIAARGFTFAARGTRVAMQTFGEGGDPIFEFKHTANTRTDKNNVLHSGTGTPITTLNVSDMAQDVVNRDDMTVTSGAVYRGLEKKITGGSVVQKTGTSTVDAISQKAFTNLSLGVIGDYYDVTGERIRHSIYINTLNKPIFVSVQTGNSDSKSGIFVGKNEENLTQISNAYSSTTQTHGFIVMPGYSYQCTAVINKWTEMR